MPTARGKPLTAEEAQAQDTEIWRLRTRHLMTHREIAIHTGLSTEVVSAMLKRLREEHSRYLMENIRDCALEQVEMLQTIASEAAAAWEKSKGNDKQVTKKSIKAVGSDGELETIGPTNDVIISQIKDSDGDPRFLAEMRGALGDIRKIPGVEAPERRSVTIQGPELPQHAVQIQLQSLTAEQLRALAWQDQGIVIDVLDESRPDYEENLPELKAIETTFEVYDEPTYESKEFTNEVIEEN